MAGHIERYRQLVAAIWGLAAFAVGNGSGGSLNFKLMDLVTLWILTAQEAYAQRILELLAEMKAIGHMTIQGPNKVASEQGSPGAHWYFNWTSILGCLKWARKRRHLALTSACEEAVYDEVALCREYSYGGVTALCGPRIKDEIEQDGGDGYRDVFLALGLGQPIRKPKKYWNHQQAAAVRLMRTLCQEGVIRPEVARRWPLPKLYIPLHRIDLSEGFFVYIEDTPEARQAMGKDACNWVLLRNGEVTEGYDWAPFPEGIDVSPREGCA